MARASLADFYFLPADHFFHERFARCSEQGKEHKADVSHISEVPNTSKYIEGLTDFSRRAFRKND